MREPLSNVRATCRHMRPYIPTQDTDPVTGQRFVKVDFPTAKDAPYKRERMWVKVTSFEDRVGELNNDPFHLSYTKNGDIIHFTKTEDGYMYVPMPKAVANA